ncbi:hypothetical protein M0R36_03460 [bacterium]|jgi:hypothetical protein|nr:hypothetical protein [bacterium]
MSKKVIGILLLALTAATVVGMVIKNESYWTVYNYIVVALSAICGVVLLGSK